MLYPLELRGANEVVVFSANPNVMHQSNIIAPPVINTQRFYIKLDYIILYYITPKININSTYHLCLLLSNLPTYLLTYVSINYPPTYHGVLRVAGNGMGRRDMEGTEHSPPL